MLNFVVPIVVAILVAFGWILVWRIALRVIGITTNPVVGRPMDPELLQNARNDAREMGRLRYVLIYGVLGPGLGFGLAIIVANMIIRHFTDWVFAAILLAAVALGVGSFHGLRAWSDLFREPVPFPPPLPPVKG